MFHTSQGIHTRQAHKGIPDGCFEEEQGRKGFFGAVSHLIRKEPSTRWTKIEGPLKPRMYDLVKIPNQTTRTRMLYNKDVSILLENHPVSADKDPTAFRNGDGDSIYFCHSGKGVVLTEYGLIHYRPGDYLVIPKSLSHSFQVEEESRFFVVISHGGNFWEPDRGIVGRHAVYDIEQIEVADLAEQEEFLAKHKLDIRRVDVQHQNEITKFEYASNIFDVLGWKGDLFPFKLNMDQIMPLMSHRAHLPPSAHTTFVAPNFVICSFVPRPLESDKDALRVPFYHQNIDYDEVLFYHDGDFFSRDGLHAGMMSLHPAGFPHGPHPKAMKSIDSKTHAQEYAVMVDTRFPLMRDPALSELEVEKYWKSWQAKP